MRIAFVNQPLEQGVVPPTSSVALWAYEAARRLARQDDVAVYARGEGFRSRDATHDGLHLRTVATGPDELLLRALRRLPARDPRRPLFSSGLYYRGYIARVARHLRRSDPAIVQLFNFSQFAPVVRAALPSARIALRMSCEWLTQVDPRRIGPRLAAVDLLIGCSDFITDGIRRAFPEVAPRCVTVHNGRDVASFTPAPAGTRHGPKRLLYVGRISPEKGVHVLIDAFSRVASRVPDVELEIVGGREQLPFDYLVGLAGTPERVAALARFYRGGSRTAYALELERRLRAAGLADRVAFRDPMPHARLLDHYRRADLLVFPSVWDEPSGNPPIEAMAVGLPVISTRTGGTAEYVEDGRTGRLVPPDDAAAVAEAIEGLLRDDGLRRSMGEAARKRAVERFSYERMAGELRAHYGDLVRGGRR